MSETDLLELVARIDKNMQRLVKKVDLQQKSLNKEIEKLNAKHNDIKRTFDNIISNRIVEDNIP